MSIFFFIALAISGAKMGPIPKILNFYLKSDFDCTFFFRIFKKLSSCFIVDIFDLSLVVSLRSLKGTKMEPTLKMITFYFKKS
jgi:hypothetical protein